MKIFPELDRFSKQYSERSSALIWACLPAELETPVSVALKFQDEPFCCLFESVEQGLHRGRYSFLALMPDVLWRCEKGVPQINRNAATNPDAFVADGADVFASFRKLLDESRFELPEGMPGMCAGLFGYMTYDMVRYMEVLPDSNPDVIGIPESVYMRPQVVIVFDSVKDNLIIAAPVYAGKTLAKEAYNAARERIEKVVQHLANTTLTQHYVKNTCAGTPVNVSKVSSNTTQDEYHAMVNKAKEYILAGDIFQVVPSQRFTVDFPYDGLSLYRVLRRLNPSPYSFYVRMPGFALVGSSPEILVRLKDGIATVRPIAGTRKRGATHQEDEALAEDLLSDEKELAEHLMLIDLGRNDIGRVAEVGSVEVTEQMVIEYYSHVMHIVSNVQGRVRKDVDPLDVLIAGFPVGTVSGAPKIRAMEIIDKLEKERRSFYAGGVGYFSANGNVDTCIALRTGLVKDGKLYIQAGGGVVADSDPEAEYQESCNKAKALLKAAEEVAQREW